MKKINTKVWVLQATINFTVERNFSYSKRLKIRFMVTPFDVVSSIILPSWTVRFVMASPFSAVTLATSALPSQFILIVFFVPSRLVYSCRGTS